MWKIHVSTYLLTVFYGTFKIVFSELFKGPVDRNDKMPAFV